MNYRNALIAYEQGQPWRDVNYSLVRRADWLIAAHGSLVASWSAGTTEPTGKPTRTRFPWMRARSGPVRE